MKLKIKARPSSYEEKVEQIAEGQYSVSVKEPPVRGLANQAIINALAEYFGVSKSQIKIISGWTSKQKLIEIPD
jgi:uncharacterized protein